MKYSTFLFVNRKISWKQHKQVSKNVIIGQHKHISEQTKYVSSSTNKIKLDSTSSQLNLVSQLYDIQVIVLNNYLCVDVEIISVL